MGLPTEKEALAYITDNNIWTSNDESKLEQQKKYINNLRDTRKNLYRVSEINSVDNDIDKANQEYKKAGINADIYLMPVGATVEGQAKTSRQVNSLRQFIIGYLNGSCCGYWFCYWIWFKSMVRL